MQCARHAYTCMQVGRNVIHGSDTVENAKIEIALWFGGEGARPSMQCVCVCVCVWLCALGVLACWRPASTR